jgi:PIN domain nuclease of toxin-antitoxin system
VKILLDTHVVRWWLMDDEALADDVKDLIDTEAEAFISAASVWEISIKVALGKLAVPADIADVLGASGLRELPVRSRHAIEAGALPPLHRDPFDRMLVAQARCENLTLLTRDRHIPKYDVQFRPV